MKAVEEERDALHKGLQTAERAEQWYREQLATVQVYSTVEIYTVVQGTAGDSTGL